MGSVEARHIRRRLDCGYMTETGCHLIYYDPMLKWKKCYHLYLSFLYAIGIYIAVIKIAVLRIRYHFSHGCVAIVGFHNALLLSTQTLPIERTRILEYFFIFSNLYKRQIIVRKLPSKKHNSKSNCLLKAVFSSCTTMLELQTINCNSFT